jgi:hypothetical protein
MRKTASARANAAAPHVARMRQIQKKKGATFVAPFF